MIWLTFPETKVSLNEIHYKAAKQRTTGTNRSAIENAITLFDECGIIIISDRAKDIGLLNAAFAIMAGGKADTPQAGLAMAIESIESGAALAKLEALAEISQQ